MALEPEQDLTTHRARHRRVLAGVLAGAAIAVPGVAFAAGGDGATSPSTATPAEDDVPAFIQDEQQPEGDRRDCPEERGGGAQEDGGASGSAGETAL